MRISDWSSDVCSSDLSSGAKMVIVGGGDGSVSGSVDSFVDKDCIFALLPLGTANSFARTLGIPLDLPGAVDVIANGRRARIDLGAINNDYFANRSEEHTSELQSLMRISYAVFCLK